MIWFFVVAMGQNLVFHVTNQNMIGVYMHWTMICNGKLLLNLTYRFIHNPLALRGCPILITMQIPSYTVIYRDACLSLSITAHASSSLTSPYVSMCRHISWCMLIIVDHRACIFIPHISICNEMTMKIFYFTIFFFCYKKKDIIQNKCHIYTSYRL